MFVAFVWLGPLKGQLWYPGIDPGDVFDDFEVMRGAWIPFRKSLLDQSFFRYARRRAYIQSVCSSLCVSGGPCRISQTVFVGFALIFYASGCSGLFALNVSLYFAKTECLDQRSRKYKEDALV